MASSPLSRERIITVALEIADREGLEAISMRAVAKKLDVQAMSLYHHVRNKADLIDGIHERLLLEFTPDVQGLGWEDILRAIAVAMRDVALNHPQTFVLLATRSISSPAEIQHLMPIMMALMAAGLGERELLVISNWFVGSLSGLLLAEVGSIPGHSDVPEANTEWTDAAIADAHAGPGPEGGQAEDSTVFGTNFGVYVEMLVAGVRSFVAGEISQPGTETS